MMEITTESPWVYKATAPHAASFYPGSSVNTPPNASIVPSWHLSFGMQFLCALCWGGGGGGGVSFLLFPFSSQKQKSCQVFPFLVKEKII